MKSSGRGVSLCSILFGVVLLLPAAYTLYRTPPPSTRKIFEPSFRLDLRDLSTAGKIRREMVLHGRGAGGRLSPGRYILVASANARMLHCWNSLQISIAAATQGRAIPLYDGIGAPYGWSSSCPMSGVWFEVTDEQALIDLRIIANSPSTLPGGELLLLPFWQSEAKDLIVGTMIDQQIKRIGFWATPLGVILCAAGLVRLRNAKSTEDLKSD